MTAYTHRGVVEGFFGKAFDHEDRLWLVEAMGGWGMNRYLYAPKDDPLHRARWQEPYPDETLGEFRTLVARGSEHGVRVGFAVSPGLSITYGDTLQRQRLFEKFTSYQDLGARFFGLTLDDVPTELVHQEDREAFDSLAAAHADLANALRAQLAEDAILWLVPTDYAGTEASDYLCELGQRLAPGIEVGWTGRTVVSPSIESHEAAPRAQALKRRLLVWDNVPVADGPMRPMLHLGPYLGRDPSLVEYVSGFMLNPMEFARASAVMLKTAAVYMNAPVDYEPESAWQEATRELAAGRQDDFTRFAAAHRFSPLATHDRDVELEEMFNRVREASSNHGDTGDALDRLSDAIDARCGLAARLRESGLNRRLLAELEPWLTSHYHECERMRAASDLLLQLQEQSGAMDRVIAFNRFQGRLTQLPITGPASFGPRRVIYPQLASLDDQAARYGDDEALFLDLCLSDEIVAFAESRAAAMLGVRIARNTDRQTD